MSMSALLVLGWLSASPVGTPEAPRPLPARAIAVATPAQADSGTAAPAEEKGKEKEKAPKFEFTLGGKSESIVPYTHGDAKVEEGKIEITPEDNTLKAVLTGGAGANVFLGVESSASQSIQVVQEFEITCSDPAIKEVVLTLESNLAGFIRSKHKASASVRLASATVAPVGAATTPLAASYPAYVVSGAQGYKYTDPQEPAKGPAMPLGRYVLQANFVIEVTAAGFLDAHSTAIFVPESETLDGWEREHDPFKGDEHDDFGFSVTLNADSPPGFPSVSKKEPVKRTSARPAKRARR